MAPIPSAATLELLEWVARRERTYVETLAVWSSHCPRLTIWEDTLIEGLVRIERSPSARGSIVALSDRGRAALDGARPSAPTRIAGLDPAPAGLGHPPWVRRAPPPPAEAHSSRQDGRRTA